MVVFHIPVPDENNQVGVSLRAAVTQWREDLASDVPWISSIEQDQIAAGEIYELAETIKVDGNLTLAQKRDVVDARYTALTTAGINRLRNILAYWGLDRNAS